MENQIIIEIIFAISLIIAITIHEFAHAFTADHFGDPTPRAYGRVSLNPIKHLDPIGTIMLIIFKFGWGKPVPIDPYNLSIKEETLVAFAGPASNLILAIIFAIVVKFLPLPFLYIFIQTNILLAIFNLLPIPPLDGSKIFLNLLPEEQSQKWQQAFDQYGHWLLIALLFLPVGGSNIVSIIISPIIKLILQLLIG